MSIRDTIQKSPAMTAFVCLIVVSMAVVMAVRTSNPPASTPPDHAWFYDVSTGRLFTIDRSAVPPITVDGSMAVRARVYGCDGCGEDDRHAVVIEKYPDVVAQKLREPLPADASSPKTEAYVGRRERMQVESLLIAAPPQTPGDEIVWTPHVSPQAQTIRARLDDLCPDAAPELCEPTKGL